MICAPREAAARTSRSALAMLASASQPQAICSAATVTGRGPRLKCSGSLDIEHLAGVENPARVEGFLQRPHHRNLRRTARDSQMRLALQSNAVLRRDCAAELAQRLVHTPLDLIEGLLMPIPRADRHVQVAIGDVAEHPHADSRHGALESGTDLLQIRR